MAADSALHMPRHTADHMEHAGGFVPQLLGRARPTSSGAERRPPLTGPDVVPRLTYPQPSWYIASQRYNLFWVTSKVARCVRTSASRSCMKAR
eukprot:scaffold108315_cov30-Tisochrysis_lutea.AAC.2